MNPKFKVGDKVFVKYNHHIHSAVIVSIAIEQDNVLYKLNVHASCCFLFLKNKVPFVCNEKQIFESEDKAEHYYIVERMQEITKEISKLTNEYNDLETKRKMLNNEIIIQK